MSHLRTAASDIRNRIGSAADIYSTVEDDAGTRITVAILSGHGGYICRVRSATDVLIFDRPIELQAFLDSLESFLGYALKLAKGTTIRREAAT